MVTTIKELKEWFREGAIDGFDYILVVCDEFDYTYYQVYVMKDRVYKTIEEWSRTNKTMVVEVYDLRKDMDYINWNARNWQVPPRGCGVMEIDPEPKVTGREDKSRKKLEGILLTTKLPR